MWREGGECGKDENVGRRRMGKDENAGRRRMCEGRECGMERDVDKERIIDTC